MNNKNLISVTAIYMLLTILTVWIFWKNVFLASSILFILAALELLLIKSKKLLLVFIICSVGGALVEIIAIQSGAWSYERPSFFGIPWWLIPAWGNAGIFAVTFYKLFGKIAWLEKGEVN